VPDLTAIIAGLRKEVAGDLISIALRSRCASPVDSILGGQATAPSIDVPDD
jgi:hypothetical protein